jgi:hypothetical protein
MSLVQRLLALRSPLAGSGVNHAGERFTATLEIVRLAGGRAALLNYTATAIDGRHLHAESTLIGAATGGALCLWPVMEEQPFVLPHEHTATEETAIECRAVFATGPRNERGSFREEITIALRQDGSVVYAHAWGMPDGDFDERSRCLLREGAA